MALEGKTGRYLHINYIIELANVLVREVQGLTQLQYKVINIVKHYWRRKLTPSISRSSDTAEEDGPCSLAHRAMSQSILEQKGEYSSLLPSLFLYVVKPEAPCTELGIGAPAVAKGKCSTLKRGSEARELLTGAGGSSIKSSTPAQLSVGRDKYQQLTYHHLAGHHLRNLQRSLLEMSRLPHILLSHHHFHAQAVPDMQQHRRMTV
jgi:hypothetical protein